MPGPIVGIVSTVTIPRVFKKDPTALPSDIGGVYPRTWYAIE